jgi:hypothetical protein
MEGTESFEFTADPAQRCVLRDQGDNIGAAANLLFFGIIGEHQLLTFSDEDT